MRTEAPTTMRSKLTRAFRRVGLRPEPHLPVRAPVDLRGKRILLTGASSGIGEAAAEKLAAEGATVIAVARREDRLRSVVERITAAGGTALAIPANRADLDAIDELVETVGEVNILINNAARSVAGRWPSRWSAGTTSSAPWR
jgi:NAD(P)-dependent dehydrogenase (short-subunit alcohol dehydrogenase family)